MNVNLETSPSEEEKQKDMKKNQIIQEDLSDDLNLFIKELESFSSIEEKMRFSIDHMKKCLSRKQTPDFKGFWEAKRICFSLFKESMNYEKRSYFWSEYIEFSAEGKKLKNMIDEQAAFAIEQIDLALSSLEIDIQDFETKLKQVADIIFPKSAFFVDNQQQNYVYLQKKLSLYNTFSIRINSLRKELIRTEMRARLKNSMLKKISSIGDLVFPIRRELIEEISNNFSLDVENFMKEHCQSKEKAKLPYFKLRQEVKVLQELAKKLMINAHTFSQTRKLLSECWERIRQWDKERKSYIAEKQNEFKQNYQQINQQIQEFASKCDEKISLNEAKKIANTIQMNMKGLVLEKNNVKTLKHKIQSLLDPYYDESKKQQEENKKQQIEKQQKRDNDIANLKNRIKEVLSKDLSIDEIDKCKNEIMEDLAKISLSTIEEKEFLSLINPIEDLLLEKNEIILLSDNPEDVSLANEILENRKNRRTLIKQTLESVRKDLDKSGLGFEQAMMYKELVDQEKLRLEKIDQLIEGLEDILF